MSETSKSRKLNRKSATGKMVTLNVAAEDFEVAKRIALTDRYFGLEDCLNGILATAINNWRERNSDEGVAREHYRDLVNYQDVKIQVLTELLKETLESKVRQKLELEDELTRQEMALFRPKASGNPDDDIPF